YFRTGYNCMTGTNYPIQVKNAYASIKAGAGLVNPNATQISDIRGRFVSLKSIADGYPPDVNLSALSANITTLLPTLDDFKIHTDLLSFEDTPPEGYSPYGFKARVGLLQGAINMRESEVDVDDTDTINDK